MVLCVKWPSFLELNRKLKKLKCVTRNGTNETDIDFFCHESVDYESLELLETLRYQFQQPFYKHGSISPLFGEQLLRQ